MDELYVITCGRLSGWKTLRTLLLWTVLGIAMGRNDISAVPEGVLILDDKVFIPSKERQEQLLNESRTNCSHELTSYPFPAANETTCFRVWDGISCWRDARPGEVLSQHCPVHISSFYVLANVTRTCSENGTWLSHPETMLGWDNYSTYPGWSNYSQCIAPSNTEYLSAIFNEHVPKITLLYSIGYGISLTSLLVAVFIMLYFKKLYCPRNTLHLNLFLSFILRSLMSFLRENLFIRNLGLSQDLTDDGMFIDVHSIFYSHWECKTVIFVFNYMLSANYIWILMEGLYLHNLIFVAVFSENSSIRWYIVFGWLSPLSFMIPWAIARANFDNIYCWNISDYSAFEWIMQGPLLIVILVNFVFFVNIVRVLFTKLRASNTREGRRYRYIKLAKSTLVLIPLFGVHYLLMFYLQKNMSDVVELVKLYFEMICNSFQGFLVALLYCFLNGEVQSEIKKKWHRFQLQRNPNSQYLSGSKSMNSNGLSVIEGTCPGTCQTTFRGNSINSKAGSRNGVKGSMDPDKESVWLRERGHLLLEGNDDCFVSESGFTEVMCVDSK